VTTNELTVERFRVMQQKKPAIKKKVGILNKWIISLKNPYNGETWELVTNQLCAGLNIWAV